MASSYSADLYLLVLVILIPAAASQCTLPDSFQNSIWLDSDKETLTFTGSTMVGWEFTDPSGSMIDTWECYLNTNISSTHLFLVLKATSTFSTFSVSYTPFLCLNLTVVTDYSYHYYLISDEQNRLNYERIAVVETDSITSSFPGLNDICNPTSGPTDNEYHMLVKNDNVANAVLSCPEDFYGQYHYNLTNSTGTYCNTGSEVWDVCTNTQQMTFNYSQCTTEVAFSASGIVSCIFNMRSGNYLLQTVMNSDVILGSNNNRFTCLMSSLNQDGSLIVSQASGSCTKDQTPETIPTTSAGMEKGHKLVLVPHTDAITTTSSTTTSSTSTTTTTTTTSTTSSTTTSTTTSSTTSTTTQTSTTTATPTTTSTSTATSNSSDSFISSSSPSHTNNTLAYAAFGTLGGIILILLAVGLVCLLKKKCCKKPRKPPPTPDIVIEALPHTLYGRKGLPSSIEDAPHATTFIKEDITINDAVVSQKNKSNDFPYPLPLRDSNAAEGQPIKTHAAVQYKEMPNIDKTVSVSKTSRASYYENTNDNVDNTRHRQSPNTSNATPHKKSAESKQSTFFRYEVPLRKEEVSVMDSIIMDANVNYALTYHPRMIEAKREWDKFNPLTVNLPNISVPLAISPETVTSLNQTIGTCISRSDFSVQTSGNKEERNIKKTLNAETQTANDITPTPNESKKTHLNARAHVDEQTGDVIKRDNQIHIEENTSESSINKGDKENKSGEKNSVETTQTGTQSPVIIDLRRVDQQGIKRHFSDTSRYKQSRKLVAFRNNTELESLPRAATSSTTGIQVNPVNELSDMSFPLSPVGNGNGDFANLFESRNALINRTSTPVRRNRSFSVTPTFGLKGNMILEDGLSEIQ